jgi:hypothetical protein
MALVDESCHRGYERGWKASGQELARSLNAGLDQKAMGRQADRLGEYPNEVKGGDARLEGERAERRLLVAGVAVLDDMTRDSHKLGFPRRRAAGSRWRGHGLTPHQKSERRVQCVVGCREIDSSHRSVETSQGLTDRRIASDQRCELG